jgi:hypothetical protein
MCRTNKLLCDFSTPENMNCIDCAVRSRAKAVRRRSKRRGSASSENASSSEDPPISTFQSPTLFIRPNPIILGSSIPSLPLDVPLAATEYVRKLLDEPAMSETHWNYIANFHKELDLIRMELCIECDEKWFGLKVSNNRCYRCRTQGNKFTAEYSLDVEAVPAHLPALTDIEEMAIARLHTHVQVRQIRGQQYKYSGHTINFMQNTKKLYIKLPLLPSELDV